MKSIERNYFDYYYRNLEQNVYPREWLIRALLGQKLRDMLPNDLSGLNALDLGFGDCRNFPILKNLELNIYGTEISKDLVNLGLERCLKLDIEAKLFIGYNDSLPFNDNFFDLCISSSAAYFLRNGIGFRSNLKEINRVLKSDGLFLCSLVKKGSQILENAITIKDNYFVVNRGNSGLSNGSKIIAFQSESEVRSAFMEYFQDIRIAVSENDYWGIKDYHYLVCAKKK